ncbi:hypothetical protein Gpo141_00007584 [Globisporangium polare]
MIPISRPSLSPSAGSTGGSSSTQTPSSSSSSHGGGDSDTDDTSDPIISDEVFSAAVQYPFAYLSSTLNASLSSVAAFHIAPTFLVTSSGWLGSERIRWVLFADDKIRVKKLWYEEDELALTFNLAIIELERVYRREGVRPLTERLQVDSVGESSALQLSFLDPGLVNLNNGLSTDGNGRLEPLSVCGMRDSADADEREGLSCLSSQWPSANGQSTLVRMGFVLYDGKLVGFDSGHRRLAETELHVPFFQVGVAMRRDFILDTFVAAQRVGSLSHNGSNYLTPVVRFFEEGFPVVCGGLVIAPDAILTTASCVKAYALSSGVYDLTGDIQEFSILSAATVVHPLYQRGLQITNPRYNFAIVKPAVPLTVSAVVALAPRAFPTGSVVVRVDLSVPSEAVASKILDSVVCSGTRSLATGAICASADTTQPESEAAALLGVVDGTIILAGLQTSHGSEPFTDSYTSILDAVDFVNMNAVGRKWGNESSETEEISDDLFRSSIAYPFVYLSSTQNASLDSVAGVFISPNIVVTNAEWIKDQQQLSWVLVGDDKIPVQKILLEQDYRSMLGLAGNTSDLALIKLERPYAHSNSTAGALPSTSASGIEVHFLDPLLLWRGLPTGIRSSLDSDSACSLDDTSGAAGEDGVECVHSMQTVPPSARGTLVRMAFAFNGSQVTGVSTRALSLSEDIRIPFSRLNYEPREAFVQFMTSLWSDEDTTSSDDLKYRSSTVQLIASETIIDCGGMVISPQFVLTTASCVQAHDITAVLHESGDNVAIVEISPRDTVVHPLYRSGEPSTLRYNFAILKLSSPQTSAPQIALAPYESQVGSEVIRVDLSGSSGSHMSSFGKVLEPDRCSLFSSAPVTPAPGLPNGTVCAGNQTVGTRTGNSGSAALLGTLDGTLVLIGLQVGPDDDPYTDSYASVLASANFINAYVLDHMWGNGRSASHSNLRVGVSYMVGLRLTKNGQRFCGGVLIAPQYVLTAAHCVADGLVQWVTIGYSPTDGLSSTSSEEIQVLSDRIHIHPQFGKPNMYSFDAAVLELAAPAYHLPVAINTTSDFVDGTGGSMYSFGAATDSTTVLLRNIKLALWSRKKCQSTIPSVDSSALCAGGLPGFDACTGDSGSPLVVDEVGGVGSLVGLVSAGYGCGQAGVPGIYTRVATIRDFITAYTAPTPDMVGSQATGVPTTSPSPSTTLKSPSHTSIGGGGGISSGIGGGEYQSAITHQELPQTSEITKDKVLGYLVGNGDGGSTLVSKMLADQLLNPSNGVTLYSTGDLSGVRQVIATHNALALNQREDRFGTVSARSVGEQLLAVSEVCT